MARAINSLPVPVSPTKSTLLRAGATKRVLSYTAPMAGLSPTIPGKGASKGSAGGPFADMRGRQISVSSMGQMPECNRHDSKMGDSRLKKIAAGGPEEVED